MSRSSLDRRGIGGRSQLRRSTPSKVSQTQVRVLAVLVVSLLACIEYHFVIWHSQRIEQSIPSSPVKGNDRSATTTQQRQQSPAGRLPPPPVQRQEFPPIETNLETGKKQPVPIDDKSTTQLHKPADITVDRRDVAENDIPLKQQDEISKAEVVAADAQQPIPQSSSSRKRMAIVIPFRESNSDKLSQGADRERNLEKWLDYMADFFPADFLPVITVYVVEQCHEGIFNKGLLFNAGFDFVTNNNKALVGGANPDYFVFHDVDQIPKEKCAKCYDYRSNPSKIIRETNISIKGKPTRVKLSPTDVGGAFMITPDIFRKVNGYSNLLPGWGVVVDENNAYRIKQNLAG